MNVFLFENKQGDLNSLVANALEEAELWKKIIDKEKVNLKNKPSPFSKLNTHWIRLAVGVLKCNVYAAWLNESYVIGGAWIVRDSNGEVVYHARDAFVSSVSRIQADFCIIEWSLQAILDMQILDVEVWYDASMAISALRDPGKWPRFRYQIDRIICLSRNFCNLMLCFSLQSKFSGMRQARSVTWDGRLRLYLSLGGPAWLHSRIGEKPVLISIFKAFVDALMFQILCFGYL